MSKGDEAFKQCLEAACCIPYSPKYVTSIQRPAWDGCVDKHHPKFDTSEAMAAILLSFFLMMLVGYGVILASRSHFRRNTRDSNR